MSCNIFWVASLVFSIRKIISTANRDNVILFKPWMPFIYFSCLNALARTSTPTTPIQHGIHWKF